MKLRRSLAFAASMAAVAAGVAATGAWVLCRPGNSSCGSQAARPSASRTSPLSEMPSTDIRLTEVTAQTGIGFVHTDGSSGRRYIMESMSSGLALVDYDGDGLVDIYFPNGAPLPGCRPGPAPRHALYRNLGNWRFAEVASQAGCAATAFGLGICAGDYDSDGDPDLYLSNFGPNVLYRNNGDGTFTDVTAQAGVGRGHRVGAGVCFLDADGDGLLDLFVSNYVRFSFENHRPAEVQGVPMYPGPLDHDPEENLLFMNCGDGTFRDASRASGIAGHLGTGMGTIALDADDDGDTDIYVANDEMANFLFENDGHGRFTEVAIAAGVAYDDGGLNQSSMGVEAADYDLDGRLDLYVTSYQGELATLYRNLGQGIFHDVTRITGAGEGTLPWVTWGAGFVDFDHDGDRDLYVACGHTDDTIALRDPSTSYAARNLVLQNLRAETGRARFVNVSPLAGDGLTVEKVSRGAAFDDLDDDGDIDVVVQNSRDRPTVLRNLLCESGNPHRWIQVRLLGTQAPRDGVGARVTVVAGDLRQVDEVHSGRGYQSHYGQQLHFGLGHHTRVDRLEVRWPTGALQHLKNVASNQIVRVVEPIPAPDARVLRSTKHPGERVPSGKVSSQPTASHGSVGKPQAHQSPNKDAPKARGKPSGRMGFLR